MPRQRRVSSKQSAVPAADDEYIFIGQPAPDDRSTRKVTGDRVQSGGSASADDEQIYIGTPIPVQYDKCLLTNGGGTEGLVWWDAVENACYVEVCRDGEHVATFQLSPEAERHVCELARRRGIIIKPV